MSYVPTSGNAILFDAPGTSKAKPSKQPGTELATWLVGKFDPWEKHRIDGYQKRWGEYWRLWRGQWSQEDKNRGSERSRIVTPALSQAIEMTTAELEEALFSRDVWFDVQDDIADQEKLDALIARDNLREDLDTVGAKSALADALLNGAIFGTGIVKMVVDVCPVYKPVREEGTKRLVPSGEDKVYVRWESIRPDEFVPDPAGREISEMLGCFHVCKKPRHYLWERVEAGVYRRDATMWVMGGYNGGVDSETDREDPQAMLQADEGDEVEILEYHGKVPVSLLNAAGTERVGRDADGNVVITEAESPVDAILNAGDDDEMVEAIVTIANRSVLLRAMVNPFTMQDRSVVAFQFERVPGRFWGRGVAEKGFNPQKALDAEVRARIDALGFISSPMIAIDGGRVPRGFRMEVKPGKTWVTQGPPSEVLSPVMIGQLQPNTFNQTQEMERMVQMGTGSFDTASQLKSQGGQSNGPSPTNVSMSMGAFVKRAKRAIRNVNDQLVKPLLTQTMWRYMQFAPRRYPQDYEFRVLATLGIAAREVEAMQLTQLIAMMPEQFPQVGIAVAKGIVDLSSVHNKAEVLKAMEQAMAPPSEEEQRKQQELQEMQFTAVKAETEGKLLDNQKTLAETRKLLAQALEIQRSLDQNDVKVQTEVKRLELEMEQLNILREQNHIALARVAIEQQRVQNESKKANTE